MRAKIHITNLYDATYISQHGDKFSIMETLNILCDYNAPLPYGIDTTKANNYIKNYLDKAIQTDYELHICDSVFQSGDVSSKERVVTTVNTISPTGTFYEVRLIL